MPKVLLPELAESVVEGEIVQWLVAEGSLVAEDQALVEVMTDKVTVELPSPYAGVLQKQLVCEGDIVPVNAAIALIGEKADSDAKSEPNRPEISPKNETFAAKDKPVQDGSERSLFTPDSEHKDEPLIRVSRASSSARASASLQARSATVQTAPPPKTASKITGPFGRVLAVPAARKLARDLHLNIDDISGSGPNGRIRVDDVQQHQTNIDSNLETKSAEAKLADKRIPMRGLRRAISKQMLHSHLNTVRTLHVDEADVTGLVTLRDKLKPAAAERGTKLSYLPIIMKAVVAALRSYPVLNSSLDEKQSEIILKSSYNLGLAVATEAGLVVPVVKNVDTKSLFEVAQDVSSLAEKARGGRLEPADVKGGTFSITNIGSLGGLFSFPIINTPEAAILGVHSIKKRPVVLADDSIVARQMLYLSLSFDHRIVDGAQAAQFTSHLIKLLETPETLLLDA